MGRGKSDGADTFADCGFAAAEKSDAAGVGGSGGGVLPDGEPLSHGLDRREARQYCDRNRVITGFFREYRAAGYTFVKGHMITYGKRSIID